MAAAQPENHSVTRTLRRLLAGFPVEWLPALFDLTHALFQWITARHDGLYDILDYDSTLELLDRNGKRAVFRKHQRVKFLQDNVIAFQDYAWGEGDIFAQYRVSPGRVADRYQEGDRWTVLISLRESKQRGDVEEFAMERTVTGGFTRAEEWRQVEIRHPTRHLRLAVIFPRGRPCRRAFLTRRSRNHSLELDSRHFLALPDGRQMVRWETTHVPPLEIYTLHWEW